MRANVRWQMLMLWILKFWKPGEQSIVGLTFRDNIDFEERARYRNQHECDPLYWHPLHMPDHCNRMFKDLIRTRLADKRPFDDKAEKQTELFRRLFHLQKPHVPRDRSSLEDSSYSYSDESCSDRSEESKEGYIVGSLDRETETKPRYKMPPFMQMLNMVQDDAMEDPAAPIFGVLPSLGLSTIYRQSVSTKTENMIKKVSKAYALAAQDTYKELGFLPFYPPVASYNNTNPDSKTIAPARKTAALQNHKEVRHKLLQINRLS